MNLRLRERALAEAEAIGVAIGRAMDHDPGAGIRGWGLGHGRAGLLFFYADLFRGTREQRFRKRAERLAEEIRAKMDAIPVLGGWVEGRLGAALSLLRAGHLLEREDLQAAGVRGLREAGPGLTRGDVYAGLSGSILAALAASDLLDDRSWVNDAEVWAERLIKTMIRPRATGAALLADRPTWFPLLGFGHGAAGGALALAALGYATREPLYLYVARSLFAYEDSWYRPDWLNWPDGRMSPEEALALTAARQRGDGTAGCSIRCAHPVAWCNGKSGLLAPRLVAVCRWRLMETAAGLGVDKMRDPIWRWSGRGPHDHTLCCGWGGAVELHLLAWRFLRHPRFERYVGRCLEELYELREATGDWVATWRRAPRYASNGFLKGRAGVGYLLLRVADPEAVPSPLLFGAESVAGDCPDDSPRLCEYRQRLLRSYWSPLKCEVLDTAVARYLITHPAASVVEDLTGFPDTLSERSSLMPGVESSLAAVHHRLRLEREPQAVVTTADDLACLQGRPLPTGPGIRYALAPGAGVCEDGTRTLVVGRRLGFGTMAELRGWGRTLLRLLAVPATIDRLHEQLAATGNTPNGATPELIAVLQRLWILGALCIEETQPAEP